MRGFIALEVPEPVNVELDGELAMLRGKLPPARWVPAANRHLTLVFLGPIEARDLERLDDALAPVFAGRRPLELELAGCGTFPAKRPGRVVWLGFRASEALTQLQRSVSEACRSLDFEIERGPFSPHLTLARCRTPWPKGACDTWRNALPAGAGRGIRGRTFAVRRGCLFQSIQGSRGVHYDVVRSYPLGVRTRESVSPGQGGE